MLHIVAYSLQSVNLFPQFKALARASFSIAFLRGTNCKVLKDAIPLPWVYGALTEEGVLSLTAVRLLLKSLIENMLVVEL